MFDIHTQEIEWGGRPLKFETGRIARQAHGSVVVTYGDTTVMANVTAAKEPRAGIDFFPLTVDYREKTYAAGKIPGGFFKREARPAEKETLTSRLIDRPIRPLFVKGFKNETQVILTVLSHDLENDPDVVAMVAASAALTISGLPFLGPIGGARVGLVDGELVLNPFLDEMENSSLDLMVAGTQDAVLMVESQADELSEKQMLDAVMFGHRGFQPVIDAIIKLAEKAAKEPFDMAEQEENTFIGKLTELAAEGVHKAYEVAEKLDRQDALGEIRDKLKAQLLGDDSDEHEGGKFKDAFKKVESDVVRGNILKTGKRIDGRDLKTVRPIVSEVGVLPRTHGSALFTRGETQALVVATLGTGDDEQFIDALEGTYKEHFLLHYNFPPYSVGEVGRTGFTSRREIGHGKLAWRAVKPILPTKEDFPYTLRVVSEITESNGSSSMATVCGTSLALMDAGVPVAKPVAGIAMGLIKEGDDYAVLSDILGDEDHLGDMDFKVAGSRDGVTSLQMDIKITGITEDIMKTALDQAKEGRLHILDEMGKAIDTSRDEVGEFAPRIETITVPKDKIRDVIGQGGSVIRGLVEETGAKIDINDDGTVKVAASQKSAIDDAISRIKMITSEPEVGEIYEGKVVKVVDFGAFVNYFGPKDGLVHISQLTNGRPETVGEVVSEGDKVFVKLVGFDDRGKTRLSMKVVDQETGKEVPLAEGESEDTGGRSRGPRRDGGGRPPRRDRD